MPDNPSQRGVSLYSYQQEYFLGELSLEDGVRISAELGAPGIETIAEQMMPGFPELDDAFYAQWHEWMERYGTFPTAHDMFLDTMLHKGRVMTDEEMIASVQRDIRHAAKLGCTVIRMLVITPPHIVERCLDEAARHGVKLALEIHAPHHVDTPWMQEHLAVYEKHGPEHVGFMPDMGIFVKRFPRVISERFLRDGATPEHVAYILDRYAEAADRIGPSQLTMDLEELPAEVESRGGNAKDLDLAQNATRYIHSEPSRLREIAPYIHHIHGKFYEMTDEGSEYSIPYEEVVPVLLDLGYTGVFSSEYEGQRHIQDVLEVDSVEQVRRQQQMLERILTSAGKEQPHV
jgi:sugar phosphate isomerase/epimerase